MVDAVKDWTVTMGRYETAAPIVLPVPGVEGAHWVVGGSTGCGKTLFVKLLLAQLAVRYGKHIAVVVADPGWVSYKRFLPRLSSLAYGYEQGPILLDLVKTEMDRRLVAMYQHGIEEWTPEAFDKIGPYLILVVDELAAITLAPKPVAERGKKRPPSAEDRLVALAQQMRKTGGGLVLATQSPKVQVISNLVLEQCPIRWCGRTKGPEQTKAILDTDQVPCHDTRHPKGIPLNLKGVCYVDDGLHIRRGRTDGIQPEVFAHVGNDYAADRFDFGWPHEILPDHMGRLDLSTDSAVEVEEGTTA